MKFQVGTAGELTVDRSLCIGSGQCVLAAADVFDQDDDEGLVEVVVPEIDPVIADDVIQAADGCPSQALRYLAS
ncbi:ferredoxin [Acrocarpospora macrocephala]|uniref:Ferredoxin n=1 Tax=Acrocarpospora macrocephala TaxID=150177 RepID=A0A5M3WIN4_9ACTN|nr:ferredoxin [Acrocarpospora macrocephala]GES08012.1 ferredoxin [Acrocarpospora macrocephala]